MEAHSNNNLASQSPSATDLINETLANATLDDAGIDFDIGHANGSTSTGDVVAEGILVVLGEGKLDSAGELKRNREWDYVGKHDSAGKLDYSTCGDRSKVLPLVFLVFLPTHRAYFGILHSTWNNKFCNFFMLRKERLLRSHGDASLDLC